MDTLADRYKMLREQKGLSHRQIAELTDSNPTTISQIETGQNENFKISLLLSLCKVLECSTDYLLKGRKNVYVSGYENLNLPERDFIDEYILICTERREKVNKIEFMTPEGFKINRKLKNLTMRDVASRLGVSYQYVSMWENGESVVPLKWKDDIESLFYGK
jgi:transcriptional regulator with XRE-family HTH domain